MKINQLVDSIIAKYRNYGLYKDVSDSELYKSIKNCLEVEYKEKMGESLDRLEKLQRKGYTLEELDYEIEQMKVEQYVSYKVKELSVCCKADLKSLIK